MKNLKKLIAILLTMAMLFTLAACDESGGDNPPVTTTPPATTTTPPPATTTTPPPATTTTPPPATTTSPPATTTPPPFDFSNIFTELSYSNLEKWKEDRRDLVQSFSIPNLSDDAFIIKCGDGGEGTLDKDYLSWTLDKDWIYTESKIIYPENGVFTARHTDFYVMQFNTGEKYSVIFAVFDSNRAALGHVIISGIAP